MQVVGQYALGSHLTPDQYGTMLRDAGGNSLTKEEKLYRMWETIIYPNDCNKILEIGVLRIKKK